MAELKSKRWYDEVRAACSFDFLADKDGEKLAEVAVLIESAAAYYLDALVDAEKHLLVVGKLEQMKAENSGLGYFYSGFFTDAQQIRIHLEMIRDEYKSKLYVWFTTSDDAKAEYGKLSATEVKNLVEAEEMICVLEDLIRLMANRMHVLENVKEGFVSRGIDLGKIIDGRVAGIEEVWIDGTRETVNA